MGRRYLRMSIAVVDEPTPLGSYLALYLAKVVRRWRSESANRSHSSPRTRVCSGDIARVWAEIGFRVEKHRFSNIYIKEETSGM